MSANRRVPMDITGATLQVLCIVLLIVSTLWTIRPFLKPLVWAVIIVVATWPVMVRIQAFLCGKRWLAVIVMCIGLLMVLVIPLSFTISTIVTRSEEIRESIRSLSTLAGTSPPGWLTDIPVLGPRVVAKWQEFVAEGSRKMSAQLVPYSDEVISWFAHKAGSIGLMILNFLVTVIIAAILYAKGEAASEGTYRLVGRLARQRGTDTLTLAARAVRGVALGVFLTALIQTVIGATGLALVNMPAIMILAAIMLLLCIAQLGPGLVLVPCVVWLYWSGQTIPGTVLLVFTIIGGTIDNFIRPLLIKKGADLPLVLIFAGVIGGLVAFGIIGLFIGPVVLGVVYTLLQAWVMENDPAEQQERRNCDG